MGERLGVLSKVKKKILLISIYFSPCSFLTSQHLEGTVNMLESLGSSQMLCLQIAFVQALEVCLACRKKAQRMTNEYLQSAFFKPITILTM